MASSIPPPEALKEFLGATTRHVRRIEIYESDGTTRWVKDTVGRLKDGSVTLDYTRDERRALDLTLSNDDGVLVNAPGEFWYDKIIKVYRGVKVNQGKRLPKVLIISDSTTAPHAAYFRAAMVSLGYGDVQTNVLASNYSLDVAPYDIIVALGGSDKSALLVEALRNNKSVFAFGPSSSQLYDSAFTAGGWTKESKSTAGPAIRASVPINNGQTATSSTTTVVVPSTAQAGDVAYMDIILGNTTDTITTPAGWTLVSSDPITTITRTLLYSKTLVAGDVGATVSLVRSAAGRLSGNLTIVSGAQASQAIVGKTVDTAGTFTSQVLPTLSNVPAGSLILAMMPRRVGTGSAPDVTQPSDFTTDADRSATAFSSSTQLSSETAYMMATDPGTYGGETITVNASSGGTSYLIAFLPIAMVSPRVVSDIRTIGWRAFAPDSSTTAYNAPIAITAAGDTSLFGVGYSDSNLTSYAISSFYSSTYGKAVAVHYPLNTSQYMRTDFYNFLRAAMQWLNPVQPLKIWETQIGEFMIDRIDEADFPFEMKITGRDYTKKCMGSKYAQATQFDAGQTLEGLIGVIATAAGITKKLLPATGIVVGQSFFFERNTSRWDAMKQIATAYNYEIYFNASGYLVIRPFRDPTTSAPVIWINTGKDGQVASYGKSTSDSELFNHILVAGESSDQNTPPVFAEAKNTDPNSKTSIAAIGDRYWEYTSPLITTTAQAQALADSLLAIHSLEEFELSFETLMLIWLEAGDILGWIDPRPNPGDPRTFLLSSLTIPLGLSPMSGVGKRVLIVGF